MKKKSVAGEIILVRMKFLIHSQKYCIALKNIENTKSLSPLFSLKA